MVMMALDLIITSAGRSKMCQPFLLIPDKHGQRIWNIPLIVSLSRLVITSQEAEHCTRKTFLGRALVRGHDASSRSYGSKLPDVPVPAYTRLASWKRTTLAGWRCWCCEVKVLQLVSGFPTGESPLVS